MKNKILFLILLLSLLLRVVGIYPGYHPNHSDEVNIYSQAVNILKTGSLEELRYEYPPIPAYINFIAFKFVFIPLSWVKFYINNIDKIFDGVFVPNLEVNILGNRDINAMYWARTVTAIIGVGIVFVIYKIGEEFYKKRVGLIAAFLVAINYRQILNSHFGLPDIYNAFFLSLAFFFTVKILKRPSFKNYLVASIFCGLSFATKYQFFSFIPLFLVHIYKVFENKNWRKRFKFLFSPEAFIVPFVILFVFLIFNPYFFVNFEIAKEQLAYAALKYRFGKNFFDFYPLSYLYNYGIGKITSILTIIGSAYILIKDYKKTLVIFSLVVPIFFYFVYSTGGGFYTRNFVTITPILLIIPALLIDSFLTIKPKYLGYFLFLVLIVFAGYENLNKDYVLISNYVKPWNDDTLQKWIIDNVPNDAKIAAHSSVPIPDNYPTHLDYDFYPAFSIDEFKEEGASYAIANYEWETNGFYWWMTQNTLTSLKYWNKPVPILSETYPALALREMSDFGIKSVVKPTYAPDANFLVAKIPAYEVSNKQLIKEYNFKDGTLDWTKNGDNAVYENKSLALKKQSSPDPYVRWISPNIILKEGFEIDYEIKTNETAEKREGFLFVEFYRNNKIIGVRLSKRNDIYNKWVNDSFIGEIPEGCDYIKLGFQVNDINNADVYLRDVKVYQVRVINKNSKDIHHIEIDQDIMYPISQGNM